MTLVPVKVVFLLLEFLGTSSIHSTKIFLGTQHFHTGKRVNYNFVSTLILRWGK